jgi:uncharacterized protein (DUF3084 family)
MGKERYSRMVYDINEKEPERYYDWMLWKNRQEDAKMKRISIDDATPEEWNRANAKIDEGLNLDVTGNELYRRELIAANNSFETVKLDMQRLTEDYYKLINRIKELSEENRSLKRQLSELTNTPLE